MENFFLCKSHKVAVFSKKKFYVHLKLIISSVDLITYLLNPMELMYSLRFYKQIYYAEVFHLLTEISNWLCVLTSNVRMTEEAKNNK